jgi:hypothetical protein
MASEILHKLKAIDRIAPHGHSITHQKSAPSKPLMRTAHALVCICLFLVSCAFGADTTTPVLTGIVALPSRGKNTQLVLAEGQRDDPLEVIEIRPKEGRVQIRTTGERADTLWLDLGTNAALGIALKNAGLSSLLYLYARCLDRSLFQHPALPRDIKFTLTSQASSKSEAAEALKVALGENLIASIPDGKRFVMVVPKSDASGVKPNSPQTKSAPAPSVQPPLQKNSQDEIIPAGMIDLRGANDFLTLTLYADLIGKKLDRTQLPRWSHDGGISFTSITPLTREEAAYAIETLLAWRSIKVVPAADGFVKAVGAEKENK